MTARYQWSQPEYRLMALATLGSRIESAVAPEADHSSPKRWSTDFLRHNPEKSGAGVDSKSMRVDWCCLEEKRGMPPALVPQVVA